MIRPPAVRARLRAAVLLLAMAAAPLGAAACGGPGARPAPRRHVVEIRGFEYRPASLTIAAGDTVVWENRDLVPHTATESGGAWDSGSIPAEGSWSRTFSDPEGGSYTCTFHPGMTGRLAI